MSITKLVRILERLAILDSETIQMCLQEDSQKWEEVSIQSSNMEEVQDQRLETEAVEAFYKDRTQDCDSVIPLKQMFSISTSVANDVIDYRHCEYQAAVAGVIASQQGQVIVAVQPTGSGKTWVQGLVAKHFCNLGKKVVVVEPNEMLAQQTAQKLALVDFDITITSIRRLYEEGPWHEVVILDEYDQIIEKSSF